MSVNVVVNTEFNDWETLRGEILSMVGGQKITGPLAKDISLKLLKSGIFNTNGQQVFLKFNVDLEMFRGDWEAAKGVILSKCTFSPLSVKPGKPTEIPVEAPKPKQRSKSKTAQRQVCILYGSSILAYGSAHTDMCQSGFNSLAIEAAKKLGLTATIHDGNHELVMGGKGKGATTVLIVNPAKLGEKIDAAKWMVEMNLTFLQKCINEEFELQGSAFRLGNSSFSLRPLESEQSD